MMQLSELKKAQKGIVVAQVTPFNKDGSLDLEALRANTDWLAERAKGKDFTFMPTGSSGEFFALSEAESKAVIKTVVEETKGRAVVMPGVAACGTQETIRMAQYAQSVGADGAYVVLPYYLVPEEEGMYLHYKTLAESVDSNFGIAIYNNPLVSNSWIKPHLMKRLSKIPNIIAVKENTQHFPDFYAILRAVDPKDIAILSGWGELQLSFGALYGCPGIVTPFAGFAPDWSYSLYEAVVAKDFDKISEMIISMDPYISFRAKVTENHGPHTGIPGAGMGPGGMGAGVHKAAMDIVGLRGGEPRLPLIGLNEEEKTELGSILRGMKIVK